MRDGTPDLLCVAPAVVAQLWPKVEPMLRAGYESVDEFMPDNLQAWLERGDGLLWIGVRGTEIVAALVTSLERKPSGLCCRMMTCGGDGLGHWREWEKQVAQYARAEGCVKVTAEGRSGWARVLGYNVKRVFLEKVL